MRRRLLAAGWYVITTFGALTAAAQEPEQQTPPEPQRYVVVVTGAYSPAPLDEIDRTVRVFNVNQDRALASSISDYLRLDSSVDLRRRAPDDIQGDLSIRGGGFGQALVLLNGMRLNDPQSGHHNLDLPVSLAAIDEIQILHGSGSTQYGSDAVTGVVNLLAKPGAPELRLRTAAGNFGVNQQSGALAFRARSLSQEFVFSRDFSSGFRADRDYRNLSLASISHATSRAGATDIMLALSDRPFGADQFYGNYNSWERTKGWFAAVRQELGPHTEADFAFRRHTDLFVLYRDRPQVFTNRHAVESWEGDLRRSDGLPRGARFNYGIETYADNIASNNLGYHSRMRGAGYLAVDLQPFHRLSLSAGIRDEVWGSFNHELSPTVSAGLWLSSKWKLRAAAGRAFRLPSYTDLYYHDPANIGSPNLLPETAWNYEAGVDWRPSARIRAGLTVFQRRERNVIDYVRYSPADIFRATNFQRLTFTGVESSVEWAIVRGQLLRFEYTGLGGRRDAIAGAISKYVFNYPIHNGVAAWQGAIGPELVARVRVGALERFARDPYAIWDAAVARSRGRVRPFVQFTNITDTSYEEIAGVLMPGRAVLGGVELLAFGDAKSR
jgi:iron complex outermembrane receptor protein